MNKQEDYECQVSMTYAAANPVDAARQLIANIQSNPAWHVATRNLVTGESYSVDTEEGTADPEQTEKRMSMETYETSPLHIPNSLSGSTITFTTEVVSDVDEDASGHLPDRAGFTLSETVAREILRLAVLVKENGLLSIVRWHSCVVWATGRNILSGMEHDVVEVRADRFRFRSYVKHTNWEVMTEEVELEKLATAFGLTLPAVLSKAAA